MYLNSPSFFHLLIDESINVLFINRLLMATGSWRVAPGSVDILSEVKLSGTICGDSSVGNLARLSSEHFSRNPLCGDPDKQAKQERVRGKKQAHKSWFGSIGANIKKPF